MRPPALIVAALLLSACGPHASRPATALYCAKPANRAQELVCNDPQLSALDRHLQDSYQQALARPGADRAALSAAQNSWATTIRDGCASRNTDVRTCVREAYQTRLVQLAIDDPATASPPVVTYQCPAGLGPLTARFYNQFDPPTAVLNWQGNQEILFIERSGSGARYGRQGAQYWEHQGEVKLDLNGRKFVCRTP